MRPLLIVKTGDTLPEVASLHGDFDWMFIRHLNGTSLQVVAAHQGARLPDPGDLAGAIITGSPASVTEPDPWVEDLMAWIRAARDLPILGVCYGHQLLARAFGGRVTRNPSGYEIGTVTVELSDAGLADPLLGAIGGGARELRFHATHFDAVVEAPPGATVLASNAATAVHAFALGDRIRGVQFHPEFDEAILHLYLARRADSVRERARAFGEDPEAALARVACGIEPTPLGPQLLRRFVDHLIHRVEVAPPGGSLSAP